MINFGHRKLKWMNYILIWTDMLSHPFYSQLGKGQTGFRKRRCSFQNCYVTNDKSYFRDITDFDVILFPNIELSEMTIVPKLRTDNQIYIFVALENAAEYKATKYFNNFFNWTWTYKLDSELYLGPIAVRNKLGKLIGPKKNMQWIDFRKMKPISKELIKRLDKKNTTAIWFASKCVTQSQREYFAYELQRHLFETYNLELRIVGKCGEYACPSHLTNECLKEVRENYYFYLAFEKALSEDYVTEHILHALNNYAIPIVYGGANYSRFMPPGAYIDVRNLAPKQVANMMNIIMNDKIKYYDFFKWRRYYTFGHTLHNSETDVFCAFCVALNNLTLKKQRRVYGDFNRWWNEPAPYRQATEKGYNFSPIVEYPRSRKRIYVKTPSYLLSRYKKGYQAGTMMQKLIRMFLNEYKIPFASV